MNQAYTNTKNKITGIATSVGVHALLLLMLWLLFKITPPNPPLSTYGTAVNFGFDDEGYGDANTTEEVGKAEAVPETKPQEVPQEAVQPKTDNETETSGSTTTEDSPLEVVASKTKPKVEKTPKVTLNQNATVKTPVNTGTSSASDGNKEGTSGNQGKINGDIKSLNYDGNGGNGNGGSALNMAGWRWDKKPSVDDDSNEEGKIVFQIKVDETGEILNVKVLECTVSPRLKAKYEEEVRSTTFSKTKDNAGAATESVGKISFIIKSK